MVGQGYPASKPGDQTLHFDSCGVVDELVVYHCTYVLCIRYKSIHNAGTIGEEDPRALTSRWLLPKALPIPARPPERLLG